MLLALSKIFSSLGQPSRAMTTFDAVLLEQVHQDRAAGEELVLHVAVALVAGDEHDLGQLGVGGVLLERDARLVVHRVVGVARPYRTLLLLRRPQEG